jgi:mRNA interferase HicA
MKRTALVRHLTEHGCHLEREGARHSIWRNPATDEVDMLPRHQEIKNGLARSICRRLGIPDPPG